MTTTDAPAPDLCEVRLEGEVTIYQAEQMKQDLLVALERAQVLELNLAGVTDIDTAGVQLLMLLKETASAGNKQLRLVAHSEAVVDVLELIDLVPYFGDPLVISSSVPPAASRASRTSAEQSNGS